jgi:formate hydrogenlyase subunit 6/NADH:ubiquinone oxidoreductase subunit I
MSKRGLMQKRVSEREIVLERAMVTRHYVMTWDLDRCVGCQMGTMVCPKEAIIHTGGKIENGRVVEKLLVDVDPEKCVMCGMCEEACPVSAIRLTINGERENPVLVGGAFPEFVHSITFDKEKFDWDKKDFVIENCPTDVISYDEEQDTLVVDLEHCVYCRQCEVASEGAFEVIQPWQGLVALYRERCVEGCLACADVCPTCALHIDDNGELALADYYCIKCGACVEVCPVKPETEEYKESIEAYGVTKTFTHKRILNQEELPIWVERWRVRHELVHSGAWFEALERMSDDKAGMVEIDSKRALKRRDLLLALRGHMLFKSPEEQE